MENELLRQLYRKYQRELYLYLYSLCKNHELAEDLLQETFLKALLALPDALIALSEMEEVSYIYAKSI